MSRRVSICLVAAGLTAACADTPVVQSVQTASTEPSTAIRTTLDGAFTEAQAERGRNVYETSCVSCHPADFYPPRLLLWQDEPVAELFDALSATMPAESPGSLPTSQYLDVLAYIFSITGSPFGTTELSARNMSDIRIATN